MEVGCYDYGFRFYDPELARFHTIDPWAEKYDNQSPYLYAHNNPVRYTDYLGLGAEDEVDKDKKKEEEEKRKREEEAKKIEEEKKKAEENKEKQQEVEDATTEDGTSTNTNNSPPEGVVEAAVGVVGVALLEPSFVGEVCAGLYITYLTLKYGPGIVEGIYDSFANGSTKNERKINPKAKESAQNKVKELEAKLGNAKTKSEKTEIKRQLRHWREKANKKSEPHGRDSGRH